jgi:hypothetical protein
MEKQLEMNASRAISVLIQGVEIAQKQGAYTLDDAELLAKAVKFFKTAKVMPAESEEKASETPSEESPTPTRTRSKAK